MAADDRRRPFGRHRSHCAPRARTTIVVALIVIAAIAGTAYLLRPRFESAAPQIAVPPDRDVLGLAPLEIQVTDTGTGLRSVTATLSQGGTEHRLASEQFDGAVSEKTISVALAKVPGVKEGPAVLRVTARDASLWNLFKGNEAVLEKNLTVDITPPTLELIADDRYVNFGGVGAIVYKASAASGAPATRRFAAGRAY